MHHPWRRFRDEWGDVVLEIRPLPGEFQALTDGRRVLMDPELLQVERRCAIQHEMIHLERGEHCAQDHLVEQRTEEEVARRLISWEALMDAARWARDEEELADELWVTSAVLRARVEVLRADELVELARASQA